MTRSAPRLLLLLALAAGGCVVGPQPSPPNFRPEGIKPDDNADIVDGVLIRADPGTVDAPAAMVIWNLDQPTAPVIATVQADGSFSVGLEALDGEVIRLQPRRGFSRGPLEDFVSPGLEIAPVAAACVDVDLGRELDLGTLDRGDAVSASVVVLNRCPRVVEVAAPRLRRPADGLSVTGAAVTLAPGTATRFDVTVTGTAPGEVEEIVLVDILAPAPVRRAITVRAVVAAE